MSLATYSGDVVFTNALSVDVDVSASIRDATLAVPCLYDANNLISALEITAISTTTFRIVSEFLITETFRLVVIGESPTVTPTPPVGQISSLTPTTKGLKNYAYARDKLQVDLDLLDETFVTPNELIGYFNEGIDEAASEMLKIDEDYFLTSMALPIVQGQSSYDYPDNIFGYKERGIVYSNGSVVYNVQRVRRNNKFAKIATDLQFGQADEYIWYHTNDSADNPKINLIPASRETAIISPQPSAFTPIILWYIRRPNHVPLLGEYVLNWDVLDQAVGISVGSDQITVTNDYITGDTVKLRTTSTMPGGLSADTVYYVIAGSGVIKLATTLQNARAGTAIDISTVGIGTMSISIAANQTIVDETIIDIPEFLKFVIQWAKCRCMEKEGDPKLEKAIAILEQQRSQMVNTLTEVQQDDQNELEPDFSMYREMS